MKIGLYKQYFQTENREPLLNAQIYLVPVGQEYPNGAIKLIPTEIAGVYQNKNVPENNYNIYIQSLLDVEPILQGEIYAEPTVISAPVTTNILQYRDYTGILRFKYPNGIVIEDDAIYKISKESITYTKLYELMTNNLLTPEKKYLITDYQTVYRIPNTNEIKSCEVEPLIVTANNTNKLYSIAYSLNFPSDIIFYDIENNQSKVPECTKGFIYRRIDTKQNIDIPFDWRTVVFRRWKLNVTSYERYGDEYAHFKGEVIRKADRDDPSPENPQTTNEIYIALKDIPSDNGVSLTDTTAWFRLPFDNGDYILYSPFDYSLTNNIILPVDSNQYIDCAMFSDSELNPQTDFETIFNIKIEQNNSDIISSCSSVFCGSIFQNIKIGTGFSNNFIADECINNIIGKAFENNIITSNFQSNNIGDNFCNLNLLSITQIYEVYPKWWIQSSTSTPAFYYYESDFQIAIIPLT